MVSIRRGTTPLHTFNLPFEFPNGGKIRIVYAQGEKILIEKTIPDCKIAGKVIKVRLSAEETLRFDCEEHYYDGKRQVIPGSIQIGVHSLSGMRMWSNEIPFTVERCLRKDGVI